MASGTLEIYGTDYPYGTVTVGGTDTSSTTWVVGTILPFPQANSTATPPVIFHVADPANPAETVQVNYNNPNGTWTVVRGAENSSQVAHAANFTVKQVVSGVAGYGSFYQLSGAASTTSTQITNSTTLTPIASVYVPSNGTLPGGVAAGVAYKLRAFGSFTTGPVATATATVGVFWDTATGTSLATLVTNVNATEMVGTGTNNPIFIEAEVIFTGNTTAVADLRMIWRNSTTATTANVAELAVGTATTVNGTSGAAQQLCLVWRWQTANASDVVNFWSIANQIQ